MNKILPAILLGAVGICAVLYGSGALWYANNFYPNTVINGTKLKESAVDKALEEYESFAKDYTLTILERNGKEETISADEIALKFNVSDEIKNVKKKQGSLDWIFKLFTENSYEMNVNATFDENLLKNKFENLSLITDMSAPVDAKIEYNAVSKRYQVTKENDGTTVNRDECYALIHSAVSALYSQVEIEPIYINANIKSDNETLNNNCVLMNNFLKPVITYNFGDKTEKVDADRIKDWVVISNNTVSLDRNKVSEFVDYIGKTYNTFGDTRTFATSYGISVKVVGGDYGWWLNRGAETDSLIEAINKGESIVKEPIYFQKAAQYGDNDIGNTYAEVNLTTQHMFMYVNGQKVLESDFVSGNPNRGRATPTGTYGVTYKELDATLNGENYSTPVKYWMPFNMDVGFHDATWQTSFGGKRYLTHGSHGCINLPLEVAKQLYSYVYKGMPVIVYKMDTATVSAAATEQTTASAEPQTQQTTAAQPQTTAQPQITAAQPQTTAVQPQTTAVQPQTTAVQPQTTAVQPQTTAVLPQTTAQSAEQPVIAQDISGDAIRQATETPQYVVDGHL